MGLDNPLHIALLVVILLLIFGAKRLPEIGRSLGAGMREFKDSLTGQSKQAGVSPEEQPSQRAIAQATPSAGPAADRSAEPIVEQDQPG